MRLLKSLLLLLVLVAVAGAIFAWVMPADLALRWFGHKLAPASFSGVRGTLWDGHADGVSVFGRDLGELNWRVDKAPLLRGQLVADLHIKGADIEATGIVTRVGPGDYATRDLRFRVPAKLAQPAFDVPALTLLGTITGVVTQAQWNNGRLLGAVGNARWSDVGVTGQVEARFADILSEFSSKPDGSIGGIVHDSGQGNLEVNGVYDIRGNLFTAEAKLAARNGDPATQEMLRYVGQPEPDGSSHYQLSGQLLKLF